MQDVKMHSNDEDKNQDEEDEEEEDEVEATRSKNTSKSNNYLPNSWLNLHQQHHHNNDSPEEAAAAATSTTIESHNNSLGFQSQPSNNLHLSLAGGGGHQKATGENESDVASVMVEKEHMFDKVVTPSDVGKLNRLVIPKQHAEKYFPLDSSSNDKGLLLNFEDRNGKLWRFRYSYWNSSQSYVMTKGWSRFVKEKKLDAGDVVSFHRGALQSHRHRLYIDWRRRPDHAADPGLFAPFMMHQPAAAAAIRWGGRVFSFPSSSVASRPLLNYGNNMVQLNNSHQYSQHLPWQYGQVHSYGNVQQDYCYNGVDYYSRSGSSYSNLIGQQGVRSVVPMIIDSVPVDHYNHHHHQRYHHGKNVSGSGGNNNTSGATSNSSVVGKRLRLFGVNMECASSSSVEESRCCSNNDVTVMGSNASISSSSIQTPQYVHHEFNMRGMPNREDCPISSSSSLGRFHQRGESSMLFDLDPSLHYSSSRQ